MGISNEILEGKNVYANFATHEGQKIKFQTHEESEAASKQHSGLSTTNSYIRLSLYNSA